MTEEKITELQSGFNTAFIDGSYNSNLAYRPQFIYNDNKNGQKVFSSIKTNCLDVIVLQLVLLLLQEEELRRFYKHCKSWNEEVCRGEF